MLEIQKKTLEDLFDYFNEKKFNSNFVDKPVITIQSRGKKNALGWCTVNPIWNNNDGEYYEINISAENLGDGLLNVAQVLLHEMCHLSNLQNGIKDCNPKSQRHNKKFKVVAESVGLIVASDKRYGFAFTSLSSDLKEEISNMKIEDVFNIRRGGKSEGKDKDEKDGEDKPKVKRIFKYVCSNCGTEIKSKYSGLDIVCKRCETTFEEEVE